MRNPPKVLKLPHVARGSSRRYPRWKNPYPPKPQKLAICRLPSHLYTRANNVGFPRERLHPLRPLILPPCHPRHTRMLASLLIISRKAYTHLITNSPGGDVNVGVFAIMPYPWHRILEVQKLPPSLFPQRRILTSFTRKRRAGREEDDPT